MKIYQTETSKKKGLYHIYLCDHYRDGEKRYINGLCGNSTYWIGGYHNDKPKIEPAIVEYSPFIHENKLCPSCVMKGYQDNLLHVAPIKKKLEE